jgi:hypothetical protein
MLNQNAKMKQVDEDSARSDKDVRQSRGVDLAKISRKKPILQSVISLYSARRVMQMETHLCDQLAFLKLAIHKSDIPVLVKLRTP